jgi:hypothetical protein
VESLINERNKQSPKKKQKSAYVIPGEMKETVEFAL